MRSSEFKEGAVKKNIPGDRLEKKVSWKGSHRVILPYFSPSENGMTNNAINVRAVLALPSFPDRHPLPVNFA